MQRPHDIPVMRDRDDRRPLLAVGSVAQPCQERDGVDGDERSAIVAITHDLDVVRALHARVFEMAAPG